LIIIKTRVMGLWANNKQWLDIRGLCI